MLVALIVWQAGGVFTLVLMGLLGATGLSALAIPGLGLTFSVPPPRCCNRTLGSRTPGSLNLWRGTGCEDGYRGSDRDCCSSHWSKVVAFGR